MTHNHITERNTDTFATKKPRQDLKDKAQCSTFMQLFILYEEKQHICIPVSWAASLHMNN